MIKDKILREYIEYGIEHAKEISTDMGISESNFRKALSDSNDEIAKFELIRSKRELLKKHGDYSLSQQRDMLDFLDGIV